MEKCQHILLLFCCGCILYGLLENLLPKKGVFAAVKAVAVLYLLLLVLAAGREETALFTLPEFSFSAAPMRTVEADPDAINEKTALVLQKRLEGALLERGFVGQLKTVRLSQDGGEIRGVTLGFSAPEEEKEAIRNLCDGMLGFAAAYSWMGE